MTDLLARETLTPELRLFEAWAYVHLGQGYGLARDDGSYVDPVTRWSFKAWQAGRAELVLATPSEPEVSVTVTMKAMKFEDGRKGWYADNAEFYCDVEDRTDGQAPQLYWDKKEKSAGLTVYAKNR